MTSTTASARAGLYSDRERIAPEAVEPWAKYHVDDVAEAHGAMLHPSGPTTVSDTPTPPPSNSTVAASHEPEAPSAGTTLVWPWAGTDTSAVPPLPPVATDDTVPLTTRAVGLVSTSLPGAPPPAPAPPTQNQAEDSASADGTASPTTEGVLPGVPARPVRPSATATPATGATTTSSSRTRRQRLACETDTVALPDSRIARCLVLVGPLEGPTGTGHGTPFPGSAPCAGSPSQTCSPGSLDGTGSISDPVCRRPPPLRRPLYLRYPRRRD